MTLAFFRRHRKWFMILMIAGVISMVFFQSWSYLPKLREWFGWGERGVEVGTIGSRKIYAGDVSDFYMKERMAGEAAQLWAMMLQQAATTPETLMRLRRATIGSSAIEAPNFGETFLGDKPSMLAIMSWMALYDEARAAGFNTPLAEVNARVRSLEEFGLAPKVFEQFVRRFANGQRDRLLESLRTDMTLRAYIDYLAQLSSTAVGPELRREFVKTDDRIKVRLAVLKAADCQSEVGLIPDDALRAQFEKYKKFLAGQSPEGPGYRIPDRVKIEYLVGDPKGFEAEGQTKVLDKDVEDYYNSRKDPEFLVKEEKPAPAEKETPKGAPPAGAKGAAGEKGPQAPAPAAAPPSEAKAPAPKVEIKQVTPKGEPAAPEAKESEKKFRPLAEVRDEIRKRLVQQEASRLAREWLGDRVAEVRRMSKPPDLRIFADGKKLRFGALDGYFTAPQLTAVPGIGKAYRGKDSLAQTALALTEVAGEAKGKLSVMEMSEPFTNSDTGESYAFRVMAFQANHEPASLDEVKEQVVADVRRSMSFEIAQKKADKLLAEAEKKGLEEAAKAEKVKTAESDWIPQEILMAFGGQLISSTPPLPEIGPNRIVSSALFRMAADGKKTTKVVLAQQDAVLVAELLGHKEPREARFEKDRPELAAQVGYQLRSKALRQILDLGSVQRRMAVVLAVSDEFRIPREGGARPIEDDDGGF